MKYNISVPSVCLSARENVKVLHHSMTDNSFTFAIKTERGDVEIQNPKTFYDMYKKIKLKDFANEFKSLKSQGRITREATGADHRPLLAFIRNKI